MTSAGSALRLGLLSLLWGSSFLWIKIALDGFSPVQIVLVRVALAAIVLLAICRIQRLRLPRDGWSWLHLAVAAFFGNVLPFALFGVGEQTVDSGMAGVLNATMPLFTILVGLLAGQERGLGVLRAAGLALGFGGTLLIFAPWQSGASSTLGGALAILGAALSYGIGAVYMGRFVAGRGLAPVAMSAAQLSMATLLTALAVPFAGLQPIHLEWGPVLAVAVLGVFGTGIAFILYYRLIVDDGVTSASTVAYLMPLVSVLLGALALDEQLGLRILAGMLIVLVGVALTRRKPRVPAAEPAPTLAAATPGRAAATAGD